MHFVRLMGLVPLGIGITVLFFLWSQPFGGFHSPPLFFRVFGSFIALAFVLQGLAFLFASPEKHLGRMRSMMERMRHQMPEDLVGTDEPQAGGNYGCPNCGAPLGDDTDVSPSGDVKCPHCARWFNIHRQG
ncbi:hypothetical protein [Maioricimonas sp. JC845]|uniref:hypothetical protein n=1 Tax=Maioricimonas sp. JC845 TaxID=3232138 RepID=UPI003458E309